MKTRFGLMALVAGVVIAAQAVSVARADLEPGRYRIYLMSGNSVEGDVRERADGAYEVKVGIGTIIVRKNEVKRIVPLDQILRPADEEGGTPDEGRLQTYRRYITDEEIEELLSGISAEYDSSITGGTREDMLADLALDEQSLEDMKRLVGPEGKVLIKPHFVMVYTSSDESARKLGSRLEAVWRHNVSFMDRLDLPAIVPDSKLEIFYFGTYKGFEAYNLNQGSVMPAGVLGYYSPDWNRSHFFDLEYSPYTEGVKRMLDDPDVDWREKQKARNRMRRWVEFRNMEVIQHETGHHIHFNIGLFPRDSFGGGGVPIWLVEGTTMLFEIPPSTAGASLGVLNHYRLHMLRKLFGPHPLSPSDWKRFIIDNRMWRGFESYQLGWAMVYYLYKKHRDGYAEYLRSVFGRDEGFEMSHTEREEEFVKIFGEIDEEWIEEFYAFLDSLNVRKSLLPADEQDSIGSSRAPDSSRRGGDSGRRRGGRGGRRGGGG